MQAQAEAPGLLCPRHSDQEIGDLLVLVVQLGVVRLSALRRPCLFPKASFRNSACMFISAYIFFSRLFSSSRAFIWVTGVWDARC